VSPSRLTLLTAEHDVNDFDCGNKQLDEWLTRYALASHRADIARTFVVLDGETVAGYVSLTTGSARHDEVPKRFARGMPRHRIPTILVARLAVDRRFQGRKLGTRLLAEALRRAVAASDAAAARVVVVDAIDERAAGFYRERGFTASPEDPLRLFRKISDIRRTIEAAGDSQPRRS
jgi:GNAT superfamily N-acetyltransferase